MDSGIALFSADPVCPGTVQLSDKTAIVLGRSSQCDVVVKHETVSRRHAELTLSGDVVVVRDLGSRNGTFVNDKKISEAEVVRGQKLRFGSIVFQLLDPAAQDDGVDSQMDTDTCRRATSTADKTLSRAQQRVLRHVLEGLSEKQIAKELNLSKSTVHNHIQAACRIYQVHSRTELMAHVVRAGVPPLSGPKTA